MITNLGRLKNKVKVKYLENRMRNQTERFKCLYVVWGMGREIYSLTSEFIKTSVPVKNLRLAIKRTAIQCGAPIPVQGSENAIQLFSLYYKTEKRKKLSKQKIINREYKITL